MTKILLDKTSKWYKEVAPTSFMSEADLENTVLVYLKLYLSEHYIFPCKMDVKNTSTGKKNRPDLVIIKKDYSEWYIIEVELSSHRFKHIEEQVDTFLNGDYTDSHANYIYRQDTSLLDENQLKIMVGKRIPEVLVIVNDKNCNWFDKLKTKKCKVGIFQIYYDEEQNRLYRFNGHFPVMKHSFGTCTFVPGLPIMVELLERDFLDGIGIANGSAMNCEYNGRVSIWERYNSGRRVYLKCNNTSIPLDPTAKKYMIIYDDVQDEFSFNKI